MNALQRRKARRAHLRRLKIAKESLSAEIRKLMEDLEESERFFFEETHNALIGNNFRGPKESPFSPT